VDWHLLIDIGGFGVVILTLAAGYGRMEQKVKDMGKKLQELSDTVKEHDEQLGDGRVQFAKIDTKLDHLIATTESVATKLDSHLQRVP
jgi:hypothetical protein